MAHSRPHGGDPVHGAGAILLHQYFHRGGSGGSWTALRAQRSHDLVEGVVGCFFFLMGMDEY